MIPEQQLSLRPFRIEDAPFILELVNSKGWLQFIGDKQVYNLEDARNYIKSGPLTHYRQEGLGLKVITILSDQTALPISVGVCGLLKRPYLNYPDIGYALLPKFEGQGIVQWAIERMINDLKIDDRLPLIYAITDPLNERSRKVLLRNKFVLIGDHKEEDISLNLYQLNL